MDTDLADAPSGRLGGRRRWWLAALVAAALVVALATWGLLVSGEKSADARLRAEGYVTVGAEDGDIVWAKMMSSGGISVVSTGRDGSLCNGTGPDVVGTMLCDDGVSGQATIIALVTPEATARVVLETSLGSRTLASTAHLPGSPHPIATGVFRDGQTVPAILDRTYLTPNGTRLTSTS